MPLASAKIDLACNLRYAAGLGRALLGAMIFSLPLMMTMEMWEFGVTIDPMRQATTLLLSLPMLIALSYYGGFEPTFSFLDNLLDAFAAFAVSIAACCAVLFLLGQINVETRFQEVVGKLAVVSFPATIGALLADKQFNGADDDEQTSDALLTGFGGRMFLMAIGAIFLAMNIAPTDEVEIIAVGISPLQTTLLAVASLLSLVLILRAADARGGGGGAFEHVVRGLAGYGVCLLMSLYVLWYFGRTEGAAFDEIVEAVVVLAFPAALGAGAARLLLGGKAEGAND